MEKTKRIAVLALVLILPVMLSGCLFVSDDDNNEAYLTMSFSVNPVYSSTWSGTWDFTVSVYEEGGVGVDVTGVELYHYNFSGNRTGTEYWSAAEFAAFFNDCGGSGAYIPGDGQRCANLTITGTSGFSDFFVNGIDDDGNAVSVSGRLTRYY